jgi:4-amino-4-deoxy-L-arabinose transferase-like glycosyltransferase
MIMKKDTVKMAAVACSTMRQSCARFCRSNGDLLLILFFAAAVLLANIGVAREFYSDDEYLYAKIAAEMFHRGDLWVPTWLGKAAFYKPPFTYWLMMLGYSVFGVSLTAARISVAATGVCTAWLLFLLGRRLYGREGAWLAGLLFITSFGYLFYGRVGMMDMPLTLFIAAAIYSFYRAFEDESKQHAAAFFVLAGASTLVKGPVSAVIILMFGVLMLVIYGRPGRIFNAWGAAGIVAGIALVLLWPAAMYFRGEWGEWYRFFVLRENLGKFTDQAYSIFKMLPYILQYFFPWSLLFIAGAAVLFRRGALSGRKFVYPLFWMLCATAVFIIPAVKLPWYMLPSLPAAALFTAGAWVELKGSRPARIGAAATVMPALILLAALLVALRVSGDAGLCIVLAAAFAVNLLLLRFLLIGDVAKGALAYGAMVILIILAGGCFTFDRLPGEAIAMMGSQSVPVGVVKKQVYLYSYYLDRPVRQIYETSQADDILSRGGRVIVDAHNLAEFTREGSIQKIHTLHKWREWKETIMPREAVCAVVTGNILPLQEQVYLIKSAELRR